MSFRESLACGLQKSVGSLWKGDDYSDFTVVVKDTSFKCHRFILSACSGFFRGLLKSQMKELLESCATLEGMTVSTFEIIINALYTGTHGLNNDNVLDVWSAAEFLQINYLTDECHKFVMENISVDTCFRFLDHATLFAAQNVIDHSLDFISRQFKNVTDEVNLLRLPFDHFYKVIAHDYLATDCEELAVDMVLKWVKYDPQSSQDTSLDSAHNTEDIDDDTNDEQSDNDSSTSSFSLSGNQENTDADQTTLSRDITIDKANVFSQNIGTRHKVDTKTIAPVEHNTVGEDVDNNDSKQENRKQHLAQLMSACRLFTVKPDYLENIMNNYIHLLVDTGAYTLMHEALMYNFDVRRRHDAWPEAAVYRASSSSKHVMVCICKKTIMAYDLNMGCFTEFAKLPENCETSTCTITIYDNILFLLTNNYDGYNIKELYMLENGKMWVQINSIKQSKSIILLPHGNHMYYCCNSWYDSDHKLYRFCCAHGFGSVWSICVQLDHLGNCLIRFHKYVLVFLTENNAMIAQCYNTETQQTHKCATSMDGTSEDMASFRLKEDVYILQRNGSLWKVFSTFKTPVGFKLVTKLWDFDCSLKGCVLYKEKLFIFCDNKPSKPTLTSLPGIFTNIAIINIDKEMISQDQRLPSSTACPVPGFIPHPRPIQQGPVFGNAASIVFGAPSNIFGASPSNYQKVKTPCLPMILD